MLCKRQGRCDFRSGGRVVVVAVEEVLVFVVVCKWVAMVSQGTH